MAKLVVIGLELGDGRLLRQWALDGHLPAVRRLLDEGTWGWLDTTADHLHISAWPSLYTGVGAGEHGVYFTFQPAPGLQGYQRFHEGLYGRPTFWSLLDAAGIDCAVLDPPYSHPEQGFGGHYVYDWGTWAHYLKPGAVPAPLLKQLERACGRYPLGMEANDLGFQHLDAAAIEPRVAAAVGAKAAAVRWLMDHSDAELTFAVFGETHVAGHYCWSADVAAAGSASTATPFHRIYRAIDDAIAAIRAHAGPDATLVLVSGDSVGPNHAAWSLLPGVLGKLGCLGTPGEASASDAPARARGFDPVKALRDLLPKDFRKSLARKLPTALRDRLAQRVDTADIDWSRTRAYCLPTDLEGYIRVNLRGREPQGTVAPGAEYERLLDELESELHALRDADTGAAVVKEIWRVDRECPGDRRGHLPDLVVRWDGDRTPLRVTSPRIGVVAGVSPDTRSGTHRGPGFVLAAGPGIRAGASFAGGHIHDFAPTLLARLQVPVPAHMRGRVWSDLVTNDYLGSNPQ
jgi:predicted AlkP superfamily phosphohydrolase/phosphomutase